MNAILLALVLTLMLGGVVDAKEPEKPAGDKASAEHLRRAQALTTMLLTTAAALLVIDARTESRAAGWAASGAFAGVAASTLWEIRIKRSRHAAVVTGRGLGYRIAW